MLSSACLWTSLFQFAARHGLGALLKDGYRTFTGIDEVTAKNIEACKTLTDILKTSLGRSEGYPHFAYDGNYEPSRVNGKLSMEAQKGGAYASPIGTNILLYLCEFVS